MEESMSHGFHHGRFLEVLARKLNHCTTKLGKDSHLNHQTTLGEFAQSQLDSNLLPDYDVISNF
jgi:hypothetical protein